MSLPKDYRFTKDHEWAKLDGNRVRVGITEYAEEQLGDVVYVELPSVGKQVALKETFGVVESVKAASDQFSPVTGKVIETNAALEESPELVNQDPYGEGWMMVVEVKDMGELQNLLSADDYAAYLESLG
ncbi:MAG: glycine cleavage system protein GcvH [Chloroflexi bacterium]|nr:glycine cleavage system protein GcvH [Chloroflexota bacterium]